jgi:DNA-binding winged helix-turn-helix (wHTH) protein
MNYLGEPPYVNPPKKSKLISYGKILVDTDSCRVTYEDVIINLLPKEYHLLVLFLKYPNHVLSYEVIIDRLWELDKIPSHSSIRSHIKMVRKAFKQAHVSEDIIETVHGLGYRLKPLQKKQSSNPIISPPLSVMTGLLQAKAIEYVVINEEFIIEYISPNLQDYCDYPEVLQVGIKAEDAFPEFVGFENIFKKVMNKENDNFAVKGIARSANLNRPEYINFYVAIDASRSLDKIEDKLLFIFFEDASETMLYKQRLVQRENELYLRLEVVLHSSCKLNYLDSNLAASTVLPPNPPGTQVLR